MDIEKAVDHAGSASALARILGISREAVRQFREAGRLPPKRAEQLRELRPEWFGPARKVKA